MEWNELAKHWKDFESKLQTKWSKLQQNDLDAIAGKRDELIRKLRTYYPTKDEKELGKEVDDFVKTIKPQKI